MRYLIGGLLKFNDIISKNTLYSGKFDDNFKHLIVSRDYKSIDNYFLQEINRWRVMLANELLNNKEYIPWSIINDITQNFINQMVFKDM
ncbi:hypothetical protein [Niallia sp. 03133]|uniref:hypothetical protein n=1 Tax=Niallia sp. 03133 TaxID=3458060 RepID=UPI004044114A